MRAHVLLVGALLVCLVSNGAAGSDDYKRKGECLAAALVGYPDVYTPQDAACAAATSRASCLSTVGYVLVSASNRRASCTWRETSYSGDIKDVHTLYREDSNVQGAIFDAAGFNSFCSLETEISLPKAAKGKYFADANVQYDTTFGGTSECVAGNTLESSCEVGPLVDPGIAQGLPRAFPLVKQSIGLRSVIGNAPFEKSVFRVNCGRSDKGRRLADFKGPGNWYRYLNVDQTTLGLPPSGIFGSYGNWRDVFTQRGFIYDFIIPSDIGGGARAEVEVLKGSSNVPAVVYTLF